MSVEVRFQLVNQRLAARCLAAMILIGCGCGQGPQHPDQLPVFVTKGTITVQGKPVAGVTVLLEPESGSPAAVKGLKPSATSDENGVVSFSTYQQFDGAPAGSYIVTATWMQDRPGQKNVVPGFAEQVDRLQGRFHDPAKSPWKIVVQKQENTLEPFAVP